MVLLDLSRRANPYHVPDRGHLEFKGKGSNCAVNFQTDAGY